MNSGRQRFLGQRLLLLRPAGLLRTCPSGVSRFVFRLRLRFLLRLIRLLIDLGCLPAQSFLRLVGRIFLISSVGYLRLLPVISAG